jgi:hypothetical protein
MYVQDISKGAANDYGLGIDAKYKHIQKDCEYKLGANEYIIFQYTPADETDENGNTIKKQPVWEAYGEGAIIRPNFEILDTLSVAKSGVSMPKKLSSTLGVLTNSIPCKNKNSKGEYVPVKLDPNAASYSVMGTFGANEQVEIRELIKVTFGDTDQVATSYYFYAETQKKNSDNYSKL